jgi:pilus assembly protein TadC
VEERGERRERVRRREERARAEERGERREERARVEERGERRERVRTVSLLTALLSLLSSPEERARAMPE